MEGLRRRVIIAGAAGRDFHNFNVRYRNDPQSEVVAFTATQTPGIEDRLYPPGLSGELYPEGIPIAAEEDLEVLVRDHKADEVVFAYSDVSHESVMHLASRALAAGADFTLLGPAATMIAAEVPVVAVCAVRTGSGKSQTTRAVARILKDAGKKVAVVRHPMPYGDLAKQAVQRFETFEDLITAECTIEEREADVVIWDGGNNDLPFYSPDVHITVADPLRAGHETRYHPGETNLRMADVVVINKIDSAGINDVERLRKTIETVVPDAVVLEARSPIVIEDGADLAGKKVLVVEDGPTLTHGEMSYGAGVVAARQAGAAELVDARPWATGTIEEVYERYPHIGTLVPAMGYSEQQRKDLAETINASDADAVLIATPIDLRKVCELTKPAYRAVYDLDVVSTPDLADVLSERLGL